MDIQIEIEKIESDVRAHGLGIIAFLEGAGVTPQSWYGWKQGVSPTITTWNKILQAHTDVLAKTQEAQ